MLNTTLCYIEDVSQKKILLLYRNKKEKDLNEGKWVGVGGKFEAGETADECVLREVFEETGLTLTEYYLAGVIRFESDKYEAEDMYLYYATGFTGELIKETSEGELHWVDKERILDYPTWEGDRKFLIPLFEGKRDLKMLVRYEGDVLAEFKDYSL
jgi:8-oxo-dGTP diphosphatase